MYNTVLQLHNDLLGTHFDEYFALADAKRSKINPDYAPATLIFDENNSSEWYKEKSGDKDKLEKERDQKYQL